MASPDGRIFGRKAKKRDPAKKGVSIVFDKDIGKRKVNLKLKNGSLGTAINCVAKGAMASSTGPALPALSTAVAAMKPLTKPFS